MKTNLLIPPIGRGNRGSVLIIVLITVAIMSSVAMLAITASREDTHQSYRLLHSVQARYLAEGALMRAKGDLLCQIAATNFLGGENGGAFETVQQKYATINNNFRNIRIPGTQAEIDWEAPSTIANSRWNFEANSSLDLPGINDWGVDEKIGKVRAYVTRSYIDPNGNAATGAVGSYQATLTGWAKVGNTPVVISKTFHHQLTFPRLFDFLLLGNALSDCSMCHLKIHGDMGQINPEDAFQAHIPFNSTRFNRLTMYGTLITNGDFIRTAAGKDSAPTAEFQEDMLATPGSNDMFIYSRNGTQNFNAWKTKNSGKGSNPFRDINALPEDRELPTFWPSVKDNLTYWFEPRAEADAAVDKSRLRNEFILDNNIQLPTSNVTINGLTVGPFQSHLTYGSPATRRTTIYGWNIDTNKVVNAAGTLPYHRAISHILHMEYNNTTRRGPVNNGSNTNFANHWLIYDRGLHPADDLDGDLIPNGFDADIDGDGLAETERLSFNLNDKEYQLAKGANPANLVEHANGLNPFRYVASPPGYSKKYAWTLGVSWNASTSTWVRSGTYESVNMAAFDSANHFLYREGTVSGTRRFYWDAQVTGIATSIPNLIDNVFAKTPGEDPGILKGVFPNASLNGSGNPNYTLGNGIGRSLVILGSQDNPLQIEGTVVVRGDIVYGGYTSGQGVILAHRNIYLPLNVRYVNPPDWESAALVGDQLGIVAGGNVVIGNFIHNTSGRSDLMEFVWGNMMNLNEPLVADWNWGADGSARRAQNHMINPVYLPDGAEGGYWQNGLWTEENSGNTVNDTFKYGYYASSSNNYLMRIGGGLNTSGPGFNANRKHLHFGGVSNSHTNAQSSYYKSYYISTPGIYPLGAALNSVYPPTLYGTWAGNPWLTSDDFKFLVLKPKRTTNGAEWSPGLGVESNTNVNWLNDVEGIVYADYGVVGGNLVADTSGPNFLEFKGTVIGRDIQILSAVQNNPNDNGTLETKFTHRVGGLYYDKRLKGAINPLGFPFEEKFVGGEMTMQGVPPLVNGDRDKWEPFRMTENYGKLFDKTIGG